MRNNTFFKFLGLTLTLTLFLSLLFIFYYFYSLDLNLLKAEPYVEKILFDEPYFKNLAEEYTLGCVESDTSCLVNKIYEAVISNNHYDLDPNGTELIRTPFETLSRAGGDCEDLAILAATLLENLNITTYLVLTSNHAYALACGVVREKILDYSVKSLKEVYVKQFNNKSKDFYFLKEGEIYFKSKYKKEVNLAPNEIAYIKGSEEHGIFDINFSLDSESEFEFYILNSEKEVKNFLNRKSFKFYPSCKLKKSFCEGVNEGSTVLIFNPTSEDISVDVNLDFIYLYDSEEMFVNNTYSFYNISNETCVVLETTAGKYGFAGFSSEDLEGEKQAFNPRTQEYFILD